MLFSLHHCTEQIGITMGFCILKTAFFHKTLVAFKWQVSLFEWFTSFHCSDRRKPGLYLTTNPVAVITDLDDGLILSQIPDYRFPAGVGRGQDVLNLPVP